MPRTSSSTIVASTNAEKVYAISPGRDEPAPAATSSTPHASATAPGQTSVRASERKLVLRQAMTLAAAGVVAGSIAAALMTRLLAGMLFQVRATDPATYIAIAGLLGLTAAIAAWRPAARAASVDPIRALRAE